MNNDMKGLGYYFHFSLPRLQMPSEGNEAFSPFLSEKEQALEPMDDLDHISEEEKVEQSPSCKLFATNILLVSCRSDNSNKEDYMANSFDYFKEQND